MMKDVPLWVRWLAAVVPIIAALIGGLIAFGDSILVSRSEYVALCSEVEAIKEFLNYQHGWPIHPIDCEA